MKIDEILTQYPYFVVPYIEEYRKTDPNSEEGKRLCRFIAANVGDREALKRVLGGEPPEITGFGDCKEKKSPSTFETIDSFLEKFGNKKIWAENPLEEYNLEAESHASAEACDLHKLMKEHNYQRVLEIIEGQNLINPTKNIYFAHQIRFLKKLIALQQKK